MGARAKWDGIQLVGEANGRSGGMRGLVGAIERRGSHGIAANTAGKGVRGNSWEYVG